MVEIEFKNMLTQREYEQLMNHFQMTGKAKPQTNIYFDTAGNHLKNSSMSLRVRQTVDGWELTLKQPHPEGKLETNQDLLESEAKALEDLKGFVEGPVKKILDAEHIPVADLSVIGYLVTDRAEFPYKNGTLFLDHSKYNGKEDYELEFEADNYDRGLQTFQQVLRDFKIPTRHGVSKIRRATTP